MMTEQYYEMRMTDYANRISNEQIKHKIAYERRRLVEAKEHAKKIRQLIDEREALQKQYVKERSTVEVVEDESN